MTIEEINRNKPDGATHYMDDDHGFDYVKINSDKWMNVWFSRWSCWLPVGYILLNDRFKPL